MLMTKPAAAHLDNRRQIVDRCGPWQTRHRPSGWASAASTRRPTSMVGCGAAMSWAASPLRPLTAAAASKDRRAPPTSGSASTRRSSSATTGSRRSSSRHATSGLDIDRLGDGSISVYVFEIRSKEGFDRGHFRPGALPLARLGRCRPRSRLPAGEPGGGLRSNLRGPTPLLPSAKATAMCRWSIERTGCRWATGCTT